MYTLAEGFENTFDVMAYTVSAMKETGFVDEDIETYITEAIASDNYHLINTSIKWLDECNKAIQIYKDSNYNLYDATNYESLDNIYNSEDTDNYEGFSDTQYCNWDADFFDDEKDAYEGFSDCKQYSNYYWDNNEDLVF